HLIGSDSSHFEHCQNAASRFLWRQCFYHSDPSPRILSHPATATLRRECTAANFTQNAEFSKGRSVPGPAFHVTSLRGQSYAATAPTFRPRLCTDSGRGSPSGYTRTSLPPRDYMPKGDRDQGAVALSHAANA